MHAKQIKIVCLCMTLALGLAAGNGQPQDLVSTRVVSIDGPVEIRRAPQGGARVKRIDFSLNDQLRAGDVVLTHAGGRLVLGLSDGSLAVIGEHTMIEVKDASPSPRTIFNVLRGKTRIKIEKVGGRPNPYRVNTPTAVIAVRGTLFDLLVKERETQVFVHEGLVAVSSLAAPDKEVLLSPGQMTRVVEGQLPVEPIRFKPGRNDDYFRRPPNSRPGDDVTSSDATGRNAGESGTGIRTSTGVRPSSTTPTTGGQRGRRGAP